MKCDCLNDCGDDRRVAAGKVQPCAYWKRREAGKAPKAIDVSRIAEHPSAILISFEQPLTDAQLQRLAEKLPYIGGY